MDDDRGPPQAEDAKAIKRKAGVERTEHGAKAHGKDTKDEFQGKAAKMANEFDEKGRTPLSLAVKEEREDLCGHQTGSRRRRHGAAATKRTNSRADAALSRYHVPRGRFTSRQRRQCDHAHRDSCP